MSAFVFVQPHLRFGGAERQTVSVANALVERGHDVSLVLHTGTGGLVPTLDTRVRVHALGLESHLATPEVARRLLAVLRRMRPSFVVVKLWSSILACAMIDQLPALRHHVVNHCEDLDPRDHASYIRFGRVKQHLIRQVFRSRPLLSANTETVASSMVDVYGLRRRPAVIPSTIDPVAVRRLAAEAPVDRDGTFTVASVGSLIPRKGLDVTWQALERLGAPVRWRVVGEGPLARELSRRATQSGHVRVEVEGGRANPYGSMAAADVLVHSARSEAWGIVLLEAMAVGTPVIAAEAIGPAEMRRSLGDRPELLRTVPVGDVDALTDAIAAARTAPRPPLRDFDDHISPFTVDTAVTMWEARAAEAGR
ncbi:glycosyltransferase [Curtobacterium sp. MCLR17_007]|uniref:glycosyltransferase n=1 Tax=Curtobacterium sp. MCLR17_007 TaxID=2175648 RepID=UPI000DA88C2C|nr:glycosyltransferase [Curtobacterium sp. MCLR17_007]WIB60672.1 glycosyltransferase [Curtobacterium sp. MCLR17_007]